MSLTRAFLTAVGAAVVLSALAQNATAIPIACHCCGGLDPKWCAIFWICC